MKILVAVIVLASSMFFYTDATQNNLVLPEQTRTQLHKDGFCIRSWQPWQNIAQQIDSRSGLVKIVTEAEARLQGTIADKWLPEWKKNHLQPIKGGKDEVDLLIMRYSANDLAVEIAVGEFYTTITFYQPTKPKTILDAKTAKQAYISWAKKVFDLTSEEMPTPEVSDKTDYWLVVPNPRKKADGSERDFHSTWPGRLQFAFAKNGEWLSVVVYDRLQRSSQKGPIAGGRGRVKGSWFDDELSSNKSNGKKRGA